MCSGSGLWSWLKVRVFFCLRSRTGVSGDSSSLTGSLMSGFGCYILEADRGRFLVRKRPHGIENSGKWTKSIWCQMTVIDR